ncbi:MAG: hypothetical protein KGP28_12555 [Bdellovibrionales bacterium]|nr:hypothetical protein [Bdellovibrionales bacterium]
MKTKFVVFLTIGVALNSFAGDPRPMVSDLSPCDLLYSKRGAKSLLESVACYRGLAQTAAADELRLQLFERAMIALSAVVNDEPKTEAEGEAIAKALQMIGEMSKRSPNSADYFYWRAVFTSFDAIRKDRGAVLPRHMFAVIRSLQDDLRRAIDLNPRIHVYGPHRVLGIMHTRMPGIVGGDKVLAEKMLREAYVRAPEISLNHVGYARILQINGKDSEAKEVLTQFLAKTDAELDPYPSEPLRNVMPELFKDRAEAKSLLEEIDGE